MANSPCKRWVVVVSCLVCQILSSSWMFVGGVLLNSGSSTFHQSLSDYVWLSTVYSSMLYFSGPVASMIITTFDCRTCLILSGVLASVGMCSCYFITHFYLLYPASIVAGVGQGLALATSYVALGYNFPKYAGLVTGLCVCGSGVVNFFDIHLLETLVYYYELHGTFLVWGAACLNLVACGLAIPPTVFEKQRRLARKRSADDVSRKLLSIFRSLFDVLRDFRFLLLLVTALAFSSAAACFDQFLSIILNDNGYDYETATGVNFAATIASVPAGLLTGVASLKVKTTTAPFFFCLHAVAALATLLVPLTVAEGSVVAQMILAVSVGFCKGAVWATFSPFLLELLGVGRVAHGVGLYLFTMGVGFLAGPRLTVKLFSRSRYVYEYGYTEKITDFHHVFYFMAAMFALASAAILVSAFIKPKKQDLQNGTPRGRHQSLEMSAQVATEALPQATQSLLSSDDNAHNVINMAESDGRDEENCTSISEKPVAKNETE